ncbi:MAG: nucleotidyltransferase [Acholeplasmatales bacterium]|nr:nucleotidyltransferase [Acholeplasmatales bacterium]
MYTNEQLLNYSRPLSDSEKKQCENSLNVVKNILSNYGFTVTKEKYESNDDDLNYGFHVSNGEMTAEIFVQGSYGNGTCVRQDSDVDIAMICESTFRGKYPTGRTAKDYGFVNSSFSILDFKKSLVDFINYNYTKYTVYNHNKCIDFKGNDSSRKDIDIVPSLRYRDYSKDRYCDEENYVKGTLIKCNDGNEIINYPEQSHKNSIEKNNYTGYMYKKIVRTLKKIKHDMEEDNCQSAKSVSSYGLECLIFNVPNDCFKKDDDSNNYRYIVFKVIYYLYKNRHNFIYFVETNKLLNIFANPNNKVEDYKQFIIDLKQYIEE